MFYNLSAQQIAVIKAKFYPQELTPGEFLKTVIVNNYGSDNPDNSVRIVYSIKDGLTNDPMGKQIFKVFNNKQALKYMKLKIFEILSQSMLNEVNTFTNIKDLENIINSYGGLSRDIVPSLDFIGDKHNPDAHNRLKNYNSAIELVYDTTFLLKRPRIDFLSLGAIFYFDKQEYINSQNVEERFIDERTLFDKLNIYNLYNNNVLVSTPKPPVQDLRLIKSSFKEAGFLQNMLNIVNSDISYNGLVNARRQMSSDVLSPNNDEKEQFKILLSEAQAQKTAKSAKKYFSNGYFSRNANNTLGIAFTVDYGAIINDNTAYPALLKYSSLGNEFIKKCKISSIKIIRQTLKSNEKDKFFPIVDSTVNIVTSGELKESNIISNVDETNGSIVEISLHTNSNLATRTFSATDKKLFSQTSGFYQYGVEMTISDGINEYLNNYANFLLKDITNLKIYLEETNKIVKIAGNDTVGYSINGSYDPQKNSFTQEFIQNFGNRRGNEPSFEEITEEAACNFIATLKLLGLLGVNKDGMEGTIVSILHPLRTSAETINYFISIYERLIQQIYRTTKNNFNNTFTVKKWFTNEHVDTTTPINIGYKFLDFNSYGGLGLINDVNYYSRIGFELNRYSKNPNVDSANFQDKEYSYLSPNVVASQSKILQLKDLNSGSNTISNLDFTETEIDIKNANYYGFGGSAEKIIVTNNDASKVRKYNVAAASLPLLNSLSSQIKNSFKEIRDYAPIAQNEPRIKNEKLDETHLMLALSKQFDLTKKAYFKSTNGSTGAVTLENIIDSKQMRINIVEKSKPSLPADLTPAAAEPFIELGMYGPSELISTATEPSDRNEISPLSTINPSDIIKDLPIHLQLLLADKCVLLSRKDNYKKSLVLNSKFQFLFNTLHAVEVLEYSSDMMSENWLLLTREKINTLKQNAFYLCRLRNYTNKFFGIDGINQIKMPIYEQYFFLNKTTGPTTPPPTAESTNDASLPQDSLSITIKTTKANIASSFDKVAIINNSNINAANKSNLPKMPSVKVDEIENVIINPFSKTRTNRP